MIVIGTTIASAIFCTCFTLRKALTVHLKAFSLFAYTPVSFLFLRSELSLYTIRMFLLVFDFFSRFWSKKWRIMVEKSKRIYLRDFLEAFEQDHLAWEVN